MWQAAIRRRCQGAHGPGLQWQAKGKHGGLTYGDLRIGLQRKGREVRVLLVGGRQGNGILRTKAQGEPLAGGRDAGDRLEA